MKKLTLLLAFVAISCLVFSQDSVFGWKSSIVPADEMKDSPEFEAVSYTAEEFIITYRTDIRTSFIVSLLKGIFDAQYVDFLKEYRVGGQVGFYDLEDKYIKKVTCPLKVESGSFDSGWAKGGAEVNQSIIDYLENEQGYIRIIFKRYSGGDLDAKIPCRHNPK